MSAAHQLPFEGQSRRKPLRLRRVFEYLLLGDQLTEIARKLLKRLWLQKQYSNINPFGKQ